MHAPVKVDGPAVGGTLARCAARHTICPSRRQAEIAVRALIRWAGDNPDREGRVIDAYIHEKMTAEIANTLAAELQPRGVGVVVEGVHGCMTSRGVHRLQATRVTSRMLGLFRDGPQTRHEFLSAINHAAAAQPGNLCR